MDKSNTEQKLVATVKPRRLLALALKITLVAASLAWVIWLLEDAWANFAVQLYDLDRLQLAGGLIFSILASLLTFHAFSGILSAISPRKPSRLHLAHLYFSAQIMKHLPGRFFGIVYQVATTREEISAGRWIAANALHMILLMYLAVVVSLTVILAEEAIFFAVFWAVGSLLFGALAWRPSSIRSVKRFMELLHLPFAAKVQGALHLLTKIEFHRKLEISLVLLLSWLFHLIAWAFYAEAHPDLAGGDGIRLCALYTLSWLAGYLSFVTPSGLGVRELAFTALANEFTPGAIAYGLILGRLSLLAIDLILGLLFLRTDHRFHETE